MGVSFLRLYRRIQTLHGLHGMDALLAPPPGCGGLRDRNRWCRSFLAQPTGYRLTSLRDEKRLSLETLQSLERKQPLGEDASAVGVRDAGADGWHVAVSAMAHAHREDAAGHVAGGDDAGVRETE